MTSQKQEGLDFLGLKGAIYPHRFRKRDYTCLFDTVSGNEMTKKDSLLVPDDSPGDRQAQEPRQVADRVSQFRDKLRTDNLRRYEIYLSDSTRAEIKQIAHLEGVTAGVAAESLLKLGIERYHQSPTLQPIPAIAAASTCLRSGVANDPLAPISAMSSLASSSHDIGANSSPGAYGVQGAHLSASKGLAHYTDRPEVRITNSTSPGGSGSVMGNLIDAVRRRKTGGASSK